MVKNIGILLMVTGILIAGWNGYEWWSQTNAVTFNQEKAQSIDENWNNTTEVETLVQPGGQETKIPKNNDIAEQPKITPPKKDSKQSEETGRLDFKKGEEVGQLTIPKIGKIFPVYWGTDKQTLKKGVGLYDSDYTVLPNQNGHTALAGHRDTVFIGLDQLQEGDRLYLKLEGIKYEYQIRETWITDAEDRTVIVKKNEPTLTLTTCYPFDFVGSAPDRYIVQSELIGKETIE